MLSWTKIQSSTDKCVFRYRQYNQMFGGSSQLPTTAERAVIKSNRWAQFGQHSRKLGGATEHLIDGSEKRICRLGFEFWSKHVIERRSNVLDYSIIRSGLTRFDKFKFTKPYCNRTQIASKLTEKKIKAKHFGAALIRVCFPVTVMHVCKRLQLHIWDVALSRWSFA